MARNIITISDNAIARINTLISNRNKPTLGVRVGVRSGGCSGLAYVIEFADEISPTDVVVEQNNIKLLIDHKAELFLIGTTMDYVDEKFKSGFIFINPNAKGHCGCGESFHT